MSRERATAGRLPAAGWVAGAGALGFTVSAVCSSLLRLPRGPFVLVYAVTVGALVALFFHRTAAPVTRAAGSRPTVAMGAGLLLGGVLVAGVLGGPGSGLPRVRPVNGCGRARRSPPACW